MNVEVKGKTKTETEIRRSASRVVDQRKILQ